MNLRLNLITDETRAYQLNSIWLQQSWTAQHLSSVPSTAKRRRDKSRITLVPAQVIHPFQIKISQQGEKDGSSLNIYRLCQNPGRRIQSGLQFHRWVQWTDSPFTKQQPFVPLVVAAEFLLTSARRNRCTYKYTCYKSKKQHHVKLWLCVWIVKGFK